MELKIAQNKEEWNNWLAGQKPGNFFAQSWEWGEILEREGKMVERLTAEENGQILAQAQVCYQNLPFGWRYAFCPQGPVMESGIKDQELGVVEMLADYFEERSCIFLRIEPQSSFLIHNSSLIIQRSIDINPRATLILDLFKTEEEILAGMHQKTRYNINLAEKKNLEIKHHKEVQIFWELTARTGRRDNFKSHPKEHYQNVLSSENSFQLIAYNQNAPVASVVLYGFGGTLTYLYGASDYNYRQLMAPHLLQWAAIKLGKKLGYKFYDFFGVAPGFNSRHQYAGVTRFKQGFGGKYCESSGTHDLIISPNKYRIYRLLRFLRRLI